MIASDKDTCNKFLAGINDTGEQLSMATMTPAITFFPGVIDTHQKNPKSLKFNSRVNKKLFSGINDTADNFFAGVNFNADKTVLIIPACLDLKMKYKQKFNLQE
jgi:hypothetical protein